MGLRLSRAKVTFAEKLACEPWLPLLREIARGSFAAARQTNRVRLESESAGAAFGCEEMALGGALQRCCAR